MKDLSHESRALLAEARRSERLSPLDKARIRSRLTRRIGAGFAVGTLMAGTASVAEAAHTGVLASVIAWLPAVTKVVSVIALTGAVSVGVVRVTRSSPAVAPARSLVAAPVHRATDAQAARGNAAASISSAIAPSESSITTAVTPSESSVATDEQAPSTLSRVRSNRVVSKQTKPNEGMQVERPRDGTIQHAEPTVVDGLTNQVAAIRTAREAIRDGDALAALAVLDREMPEGVAVALAPEAALARVTAYCRLGQVDAARRTAERFWRDYPQSPLAVRLRDSCAGTAVPQP